MNICPHSRKRSTVIFLEPNHEQTHPVAVITVQCRDCGQPFEFNAVLRETWGLTLSHDKRELRVAITEGKRGTIQ